MASVATCICGCELLGPRPSLRCGRRACARALRANDLAAARALDAAPASLAALARSRSLLVRVAVARHQATPPEALAALVDDDLRVVRELAANPSIDAATAQRLLRADTTVRRIVAANPALPEDAYACLGAWYPRSLARNPAWREHAATHPDHPAYGPGARLVRQLVLANVAPPSIVARILAAKWIRELELLATKPGPWLESLAALDRRDDGLRRLIARNPACPEVLLRALVEVGGRRVRVAAAFNRSAPEDVVRAVFAEEGTPLPSSWPERPLRSIGAMDEMARDPRTTEGVREELLALGDRGLRACLADCPGTRAPLLRAIAVGSLHDVDLCWRLALHPRCPADVLSRLAQVAVGAVRLAVARHPATPRDALERLASTPHWSTRAAGPIARARLARLDEGARRSA